MGNCLKKYFTNQLDYAIRLNTLSFEVIGGGAQFSLNAGLPFVPIAWLTGAGGPPSDFNIATPVAQSNFRKNLENFVPAIALASASYPVITNDNVTCIRSMYAQSSPKYFNQYLGDITTAFSTNPQWAQNGPYIFNYNAHRTPGAMVSQFWLDETTTPVPSTLFTRLWQLCETVKMITDPRLWAPSGEYLFEGDFSTVDSSPGSPPTLEDIYFDSAVGNAEGLAILVIELKSIE